ncbi:MAG: trypsin-like peptidase domain-containing protein [Planctomycetales bacterium]|nr:trypsin-like peptidase domain-containing protein [Planctomycetales bacterium]
MTPDVCGFAFAACRWGQRQTTNAKRLTILFFLLFACVARADEADDLRVVAEVERAIGASLAKARPAFCVVEGGSGVVITPDGWLVTNHHVVARVKMDARVRVLMPGPRRLSARLVGSDRTGDIALLKIEGEKEPLPFAPLGDSERLRAGEVVIALGNPFSYVGTSGEPTVTVGIVSATHRYEGGYSDAIQTDAPVNPGNSGGPLVNLAGEVVGVNGRVAVRFGNRVNTGVGYAIPANQVRNFLPALQKGGPVLHGVVEGLGLDPAAWEGARVAKVAPGSTAERAGFRAGDVVVGAAGLAIGTSSRLAGVIGTFPAGTAMEFAIRRAETGGDGAVETLRCVLDPAGQPRAAPANDAWLGVVPADEPVEGGVKLAEVRPGSPAAAGGVRAGDVLTLLDGKELRVPEDLARILADLKPGTETTLRVRRESGDEEDLTVRLAARGAR